MFTSQLVSALIPFAAFSINLECKLPVLLSVLFSVTDCVCCLEPFSQMFR